YSLDTICHYTHHHYTFRFNFVCFSLLSISPPVAPEYRILTNRLFAETLDSLSGSCRIWPSFVVWSLQQTGRLHHVSTHKPGRAHGRASKPDNPREARLFSVSAQAANNWLPWLS